MSEKRGQHQTYYVLGLLTILLLIPGRISAEEASRQEKVSIFVDRTTLKEGESLKLYIRCEPPYSLLSDPEFLINDALSKPKKLESESDKSRDYLIEASKAGKYNIRAYVKYEKDNVEDVASLEVKNIDVQKTSNRFSETLFGLVSVIVGALIGFTASMGTSVFNTWREQQKKEKWVLDSLLPQLRLAQRDVANGDPVEYEIWMKEFYEGGYYSALKKFSSRLEGQPDLCGNMVTIHSLLKQYEQELDKVKVSEEVVNQLNENLSRIVEKLSNP